MDKTLVAAHLRAVADKIRNAKPPLEGYSWRDADRLLSAAQIVETIDDAKPVKPLTGLAALFSEIQGRAILEGWKETT